MAQTASRPRIAVILPFTGLLVSGLLLIVGGGAFAALVVVAGGSAAFGFTFGGLCATIGFAMLVAGLVRLLNAVFDVLVEARERLNA